jgi:hypothetical protein
MTSGETTPKIDLTPYLAPPAPTAIEPEVFMVLMSLRRARRGALLSLKRIDARPRRSRKNETDVARAVADQAPGIGKTGITSTASPGKIVKCG